MLETLLSGLAAAAAVMAFTALISRRVGKVAVVDVAWGLAFVAIAWASLVVGSMSARSWLLTALTTIWGGRLAWHIARRSRGHGEDPRYEKLMADVPPAKRFTWALRRVFGLQGVLAWFIGLPLMVAATTDRPLRFVALAGVLVWLVGFTVEAVGDAQLARFKADPANKGHVMDRGLWAWTRHPNYFGDATMWWGLWLVAAEAWPGILTVLSPLAMTLLIYFVSGVKLLEKSMSQRPGYRDYISRTSAFVPLPPKRAARPEQSS